MLPDYSMQILGKVYKKKCNIFFSSIVALTCVFTQDAVTQRIAQQLITARPPENWVG